MKHINLTKPVKGLAKVMVTEESNGFGDQLLTIKRLSKADGITEYKVVAVSLNHEGNWIGIVEMKRWAKMLGLL